MPSPTKAPVRRPTELENLERIHQLEHLSYPEKLRVWTDLNVWDGLRLDGKTLIRQKDVSVLQGNVRRMRPPLAKKPCFGIPTAWLLYGHEQPLVRKGKLPLPSRCGRCKARGGCESIAESRLGITDAVRIAVTEFRSTGGLDSYRDDTTRLAGAALKRVIKALDAYGPFTSTNDKDAHDLLAAEIERERAREHEKKVATRQRSIKEKLKGGELDPGLAMTLQHHRIFRLTRYRQFRDSGAAPLSVTAAVLENDVFTADVWHAREVLRAIGRNATAYAIAQYLIEHRGFTPDRLNVLRDRVQQAFKRITVLETHSMPGLDHMVWPAFSLAEVVKNVV